MRILRILIVVLVGLMPSAQAVDQKSLLLGVAIGLGVYTVQKGLAPALVGVGRGTKVAVKATGKGIKRAVKGPDKKKKAKPPVAAEGTDE